MRRADVPDYVWKALEALPKDSHPMAMLDLGILAMERESVFRKRYDEGMKKAEYWMPTLEDSLDLVARISPLAAGIYRMRFGKGARIAPKKGLDWAANYGHMLGLPDPTGEFANLMRLSWCCTATMRVGMCRLTRHTALVRRNRIHIMPSLPDSTVWQDRCTAWPIRNV